jgi:periplasmic divalent cation tolerance protein
MPALARAAAAAARRACCRRPSPPLRLNPSPFSSKPPRPLSHSTSAMSASQAAAAPQQPEQVLAVLVTAPDASVAQRLADAAVGERLAACANVFLGGGAGGAAAGGGSGSGGFAVQSTYWWQGKLCRAENETLLLLKAPARNLSRLTARIKELHPYDEPAISALPVVGGSASYLKWVVDEATGEGGGGGGGGGDATATGAAAKE